MVLLRSYINNINMGELQMNKKKLDPNHCDNCNENCSTIILKYNNKKYWFCDDCHNNHSKEDKRKEIV